MRFKPSHKQTLAANNAADKYYAMLAGVEPRAQSVIAPKRERAAPRQFEAPVVAAISELLAVHPRVIWAARFNSGAASYEAANGRYAPVWFHRIVREPNKTRVVDFYGIIFNEANPLNRAAFSLNIKLLAIEAKAPGWKKPRDDREREQAAFLEMIREADGIGIFATSAQEVADALA